MAGRCVLLSCGFSPTHDLPPDRNKARSHAPVLALVPGGGGRAWPGFETTRRAKLAARTASGRAAAPRHQHANKQENTSSTDGKRAAHGADGEQARRAGGSPHGLRDDAPSEARGADAERAGRRPQAPTRRQEREHELRGRQAGSSRRGRRTGSSQRGGRQAGSSRHGLRDDAPSEARGADGEQAARGADGEQAAHGADGEQAARGADAERAGRRPRTPTRRTRAYNEAGTRRAKQRRGPRPRETVRPGGPP